MNNMSDMSPMRIRLSAERRAGLLRTMKDYFLAEFDESLSDFRAESLLNLFIRELGPPVYNQGVRDASSYMQKKLADIEGEVFERESNT
jgi:uncharacterized protein (DUF2164 family)